MNIVIERATAADAAALLAYLKQVGAESDNLSFGGEGLPFTAEDEAAYLAQIADSQDAVMLLAKEQGRIIGNASLSRFPRRMSHRGEISVTVEKACWNRGIGSRLLDALIAFARDNAFEFLELQVSRDNGAAIHLYEKAGFQTVGTVPAFLKVDGRYVDFNYMSLKL